LRSIYDLNLSEDDHRLSALVCFSPALATLGETREGLPNVRFIDDVGIEVWATPIDHLGMAFVLGVGHGFKVLGITPRTAHVFGGTSSPG